MTFKTLLSTVVWGEDYLEIFLEYTLKSLYTHGNLLNKEFSKKSEYIIFTEKNYFQSIRNHKNFKKLKRKIKIKLIKINHNKKEKYLQLRNYQNFSLNYGYKKKFEYFSFIYPDSIFGENHFKTNFDKIKKGFKIVMCPGPLVIYENFFSFFKNRKINNQNLSEVVLKYLHPFYKNLINDSPRSRIKIFSNENMNYQLYRCFDLHISIISLKLKNLKIKDSYDVDLLENQNIELKDISYFQKSNQGIIITLESINSERSKESQFQWQLPKKNILDTSVFNITKFCNENFKYFHIYNYIKGTFLVSKKKINRKIIDEDFEITEKFMRRVLSENKIKVIKRKNTLIKFLELKKYKQNIKGKFVISSQKKIELNYVSNFNYFDFFKEDLNLIKNTSTIKFILIFLITIIYRFSPGILKNIVISLKQRNRSNIFLNKNLDLIKFFLIIPKSTIFGLFKKIVLQDKVKKFISNG